MLANTLARRGARTSPGSSAERFNTDFSPRIRGPFFFFLIVFANTDQMKLQRRGY